MNKVTIYPSGLSGRIVAPPSKSYSQRALALALLRPGRTRILNPGNAADTLAAVDAVRSLGAVVHTDLPASITVTGPEALNPVSEISCGESALSARIFTAIAALSGHPVTVTGEKSLPARSMDGFSAIFEQLGVAFRSSDGKLPVFVQGPFYRRDIFMDGAGSSQYATAFLIAMAGAEGQECSIRVSKPESLPYIMMTVEMMRNFGYEVFSEDNNTFFLKGMPSNLRDELELEMEGDWSASSFFLAAAAVSGRVTIENLNIHSVQGDRLITEIIRSAGGTVRAEDNRVTVSSGAPLISFSCDCTHSPDLFPPLAVLAANSKGVSRISGIHRLHGKESDRALSISRMLTSLGIQSWISDDCLFVEGGELRGGIVDSAGDHRIAMAAAMAGLVSREGVEITDASVVSKSYPAFFDDLRSLGGSVSLKINQKDS